MIISTTTRQRRHAARFPAPNRPLFVELEATNRVLLRDTFLLLRCFPTCPLGIVHTASANWKRCSDRKFFGHSYTAPTPVEYTLQQLGLGVVKALSIHHSHALGKFGTKPPPKPRRTAVATPSPPRFLPHLDLPNPVIVF